MVIKMRKIRIRPNQIQRKAINEWFNTCNALYNKVIEYIDKNGNSSINAQKLRDIFVTEKTKKGDSMYDTVSTMKKENKVLIREYNKLVAEDKIKEKKCKKEKIEFIPNKRIQELYKEIEKNNVEQKKLKEGLTKSKNINIEEYETKTPKTCRDGVIRQICSNYKTAFTNISRGNIVAFKMGFKKKDRNRKCIIIEKTSMSVEDDKIIICPGNELIEKDPKFQIGRREKKIESIESDCKLIYQNREYYICIPVREKKSNKKMKEELNESEIYTNENLVIRYCGCDPGERTFLTTIGNTPNNSVEYTHNRDYLHSIINRKNRIKKVKSPSKGGKRIKKRVYYKIEKNLCGQVDEIHRKTINHLIEHNDVIFLGDIKSHDVVRNNGKKGKSKKKNPTKEERRVQNQKSTLHENLLNLRFYEFKKRIEYKAKETGKIVVMVPEPYTTTTCSSCGFQNSPGMSKIYECTQCGIRVGRDQNSGKNICMKGLVRIGIE